MYETTNPKRKSSKNVQECGTKSVKGPIDFHESFDVFYLPEDNQSIALKNFRLWIGNPQSVRFATLLSIDGVDELALDGDEVDLVFIPHIEVHNFPSYDAPRTFYFNDFVIVGKL